MSDLNKIRDSLLDFALDRGYEKTFCPSEVARDVFPENWREKLNEVRDVAQNLVDENKIEILQKSEIKTENIAKLSGPIRLRLRK